jgi:hypothetical protein
MISPTIGSRMKEPNDLAALYFYPAKFGPASPEVTEAFVDFSPGRSANIQL